jgi:hypothetical protein
MKQPRVAQPSPSICRFLLRYWQLNLRVPNPSRIPMGWSLDFIREPPKPRRTSAALPQKFAPPSKKHRDAQNSQVQF